MTTLNVFALFDVKSEGWTKPIFSQNAETFKRELRDVLSSGKELPFIIHPEDYNAFHLGVWSEYSPMIEYFGVPASLGSLVNFTPRSEASAA